ncbi:MarR family winged helix-turn-helix transcriptional regulator [Streptomyces minutiscleroticus]|uniref:MarR family transcriptional regulator n=1 Tax=Streptomyces minutiscleroticus TaxID=68238 RepID=A0A918KF09_9ACTN|nr:MarR family winged helix-turn-helix transcriptional regulator [Streptomyces minutiscleroticus]GGX59768.1 MarR family transcriptional regulator [Streptomyces minutiscleroticus]
MTDDADLSDLLTLRLGYLVKHAYLQLAAFLGDALEPFGVHPRELGVLSVIAADGAERSQNELASAIGMDRTTMVAVIDDLEDRGLVERHRSPRDRRRNVVTLTEAGAACLRNAEQARAEAERAYLAPLDEDAAQALADTLRTLYEAHAGTHAGSARAHPVQGPGAAACALPAREAGGARGK